MREVQKNIDLPEPKAPYSYGVWAGQTLYLGGVCGITDDLLKNPDIKQETHNAMHEAKMILDGANLTFDDIINARVYITDLSKFAEFNEVYKSYFTAPYPSRATVEVSGMIGGANIEIVFIAYSPFKEK
ncbi:MAG: RidA family protein [Cloacibacillus sp.]